LENNMAFSVTKLFQPMSGVEIGC